LKRVLPDVGDGPERNKEKRASYQISYLLSATMYHVLCISLPIHDEIVLGYIHTYVHTYIMQTDRQTDRQTDKAIIEMRTIV